MPIIYKKSCKVCDELRHNPGLLKRIFETNHYIDGSPLSLAEVYREEGGKERAPFSYISLTKHVKKHQFMSQTEAERSKLNDIVIKAQADAVKAQIENITHGSVRRRVMERGMEELEAGNMKVSAKDMLSAAAKEADLEEKSKDRNLEIQKMVLAYASGTLSATPIGSQGEAGSTPFLSGPDPASAS